MQVSENSEGMQEQVDFFDKKASIMKMQVKDEGAVRMSDVYATINYVLVNLINEIWEVEGKAIITDEFKDITNNDMHVIEAIGLGEGNNMSTIAKKLNITVGSLTTAVNSLVKKWDYVDRFRSKEDRRVVYVRLLEKRGQKCISSSRRLS